MEELTQPARSLTLRDIPEDVYLAIKHGVTSWNVLHPTQQIGQTDLVTFLVREWIAAGALLPTLEPSVQPQP